MRRISSATRWMAGLGVAFVAAFTGFFAAKATSSNGSTSSNSTPAVSTPAVNNSPAVGDQGGSVSQAQPTQTSPPVTYAPQPQTRTRGS
jgi:hypothetical protein